ncbi:MAG TPA: hypothetical protein VK928_02705 [Longimicrobiales bacterium]|nr:hypothetical protein [Longimicrobiales bacterium]
MKQFSDAQGDLWTASAREEDTARHHGRWYLVFHPVDDDSRLMPMHEVRWQTRATAERTLKTMSDFELRRRLHLLLERAQIEHGASPVDGAQPASVRERTNVNAG